MSYPPPFFPSSIWNGLTNNPDRYSVNNNINPDAEDWERIAAEVISMQTNNSAVLLPPITSDGPLTIIDNNGESQPLAVSAVILADATSGSITIELPAAVDFEGNTLDVKKINAANNVTLDANGSETIDGAETQVISTQYVSITIISNGTEWFIL